MSGGRYNRIIIQGPIYVGADKRTGCVGYELLEQFILVERQVSGQASPTVDSNVSVCELSNNSIYNFLRPQQTVQRGLQFTAFIIINILLSYLLQYINHTRHTTLQQF